MDANNEMLGALIEKASRLVALLREAQQLIGSLSGDRFDVNRFYQSLTESIRDMLPAEKA